jgi:hypothetical protein
MTMRACHHAHGLQIRLDQSMGAPQAGHGRCTRGGAFAASEVEFGFMFSFAVVRVAPLDGRFFLVLERRDQSINVGSLPCDGACADLHGLRVSAFFDASPPRGFSNRVDRGDWRFRFGVANDLRQSKQGFLRLIRVHAVRSFYGLDWPVELASQDGKGLSAR